MSKSKKEWKGETALINKEMLSRHLANLQGPIYYIAGPPAMVTAMRETLVSAGVEEGDIRIDEFVRYGAIEPVSRQNTNDGREFTPFVVGESTGKPGGASAFRVALLS